MKLLLKIVSVVFGFLLLIIVAINIAFAGERKIEKEITKAGFVVNNITVEYEGKAINIMESGNLKGKVLFLIHGSPGNWAAWENIFLDSILQKKYHILAIDRPGYGKTTVKAQASLSEQAKVVNTVWDYLKLDSILLVSHSYGGGIAEELLIRYPEKIKHNIYISPTLSPELQGPKWYNKVGKVIGFMMPKDLKSSNKEMYGLQKSLLNNEALLHKIDKRTTFIHGEKDWLVPIETVDYYKQFVKENVNYVIDPEESHFILWTKPQLMIEAILAVD